MARPREFDEDKVLDAALATFWSKGFDGTSIDDLVRATKLGRASLYGAFGDKEALFSRVMEHYVTKASEMDQCETRGSPKEVLASLLSRWVEGVCPEEGERGCFLTLSGTSGESAQFVKDALLRAVATKHRLLKKLIREGQAIGEFRTDKTSDALARFLVVVFQGVSTAARTGLSHREAWEAMREALDHVVETAAKKRPTKQAPKHG